MSNMIIPIFINRKDPTCPHCGKPENTVVVCRHCQHEYEEEGGLPAWIVSVAATLFLWGVVTIGFWVLRTFLEGDNAPSLLEIFAWQWRAVKSLKIF